MIAEVADNMWTFSTFGVTGSHKSSTHWLCKTTTPQGTTYKLRERDRICQTESFV